MNYYNEFDPKTAAWLRELIKAGLIPQGEVDERSITDVQSGDLAGFTQCHFFAGIGGWPYALKLAGWPEEREAWTGSCPCQPFSDAGKQLGEADERHLWPHFFRLIRQRKPAIVFGEQVASKAALQWLDGVFADLEGETYSCAAADIYAASLGAPHIRQRLFWVADAQHNAGRTDQPRRGSEGRAADGRDCEVVRVADSGRGQREQCLRPQGDRLQRPADCGVVGWMGEPILPGSEGRAGNGDKGHQPGRDNPDQARPITEAGDSGGVDNAAGVRCQGPNGASEQEQGSGQGRIGFWSDAIWHACRDGKARRISPKPGIQSLVNGLSVGMDDLRNESISEIEKEVNLYAKTNQTEPGKALHDLWCSLVSQAMGRAGGGGRWKI